MQTPHTHTLPIFLSLSSVVPVCLLLRTLCGCVDAAVSVKAASERAARPHHHQTTNQVEDRSHSARCSLPTPTYPSTTPTTLTCPWPARPSARQPTHPPQLTNYYLLEYPNCTTLFWSVLCCVVAMAVTGGDRDTTFTVADRYLLPAERCVGALVTDGHGRGQGGSARRLRCSFLPAFLHFPLSRLLAW